MEILEIPGYTEEEKLFIAKKYLVPRQLEAHGLKSRQIDISDEAILHVIRYYTREAGLRNLERNIANICRRVAKWIVEKKTKKQKVEVENLSEYLGASKFIFEVAERLVEPGVATGLAWTPAGGDILFIEATKMPGKKGLILTGHLGEVMKESARAALSYIHSKADKLDIEESFFEKYDIHIHVPAGAIPKDGPSAGITISTALFSLMNEKPVRSDLAMTGEITLRGRVLPIGGVKEKVLAAKRAGIDHVILPKRNEKDLEDVPEKARDEMTFHFVDTLDEVFELAFDHTPPKKVVKKRVKETVAIDE
jgi:ATP-dependent Lon protease